jgi:phosphohistidine phosphatase
LRSLLLLRHAKSSRDDPSADDHDRPLDARGRRAAVLIGAFLAGHTPAPDLVLCSSARRTRETLEQLRPLLAREPQVEIERDLYLAGARKLLQRVTCAPDACRCVLLIGHNPGIEELARLLAGRARGGDRDRIPAKFPTATLAGFRLSGTWADVQDHAQLEFFVRPKDLV